MPLIAATCMSWHNLDDECIIACKLLMNEKVQLYERKQNRWTKVVMVVLGGGGSCGGNVYLV